MYIISRICLKTFFNSNPSIRRINPSYSTPRFKCKKRCTGCRRTAFIDGDLILMYYGSDLSCIVVRILLFGVEDSLLF